MTTRCLVLLSVCGLLFVSGCGDGTAEKGATAAPDAADRTPVEYVGSWTAQPPASGLSDIALLPDGKLIGSYDYNVINGDWYLAEPVDDGRRSLILEPTASTMMGCPRLSEAAEAQARVVVDDGRMLALDSDGNELFEYLRERVNSGDVASELIVGEWRDDSPKRSFGWPFLKIRPNGNYILDTAAACGKFKGKWELSEHGELLLHSSGGGTATKDCPSHHWSLRLEGVPLAVSFEGNEIVFTDPVRDELGQMERIGLEGNRSRLILPWETLGDWTSDLESGFSTFSLSINGKASGSLSCNTWDGGRWWVDYNSPDQPRELHFDIGFTTLARCAKSSAEPTTPFLVDGEVVALNDKGGEVLRYQRPSK